VVKVTGPTAPRAAELRRMLDDDLRYVGDIDFIEHEVSKLEAVDVPPPDLGDQRESGPWLDHLSPRSFSRASLSDGGERRDPEETSGLRPC
jgi:hypothetical protein